MPFQVIDTIRNLTDADIRLLQAHGVTGVSRYIARSSGIGKIMGRAECDRILASGMALMVNYEQSAGDWQGGAAKGRGDGAWARGYVRNVLGLPDSVCIIQSIDTGVSTSMLSTAAAYQGAFNDAGGVGAQGCYGPRNVLEHLHRSGLIRVAWEWMGVAGQASTPVANIRQYRAKPYVLPFSYDSNTPITPYYGQHVATTAPPAPVPLPPFPAPHPPSGDHEMAPYSLWLDATVANTVWQVAADQQSKRKVADGPQLQWMQAVLAVNGYPADQAAVHSGADPTIAAWLNQIPVAA